MAIDSDISGSGIAEHHDEKHAAISEIPIRETHGHTSDLTTGSSDHDHHGPENKHAEGERQ